MNVLFLFATFIAVGNCMPHSEEMVINSEARDTRPHPHYETDCDKCKDVVVALKKVLTNQNVQKKILWEIKEHVCPLYPGEGKKVCIEVVHYYLPVLFMELEEVDPEAFCTYLTLCKKNATELADQALNPAVVSSLKHLLHLKSEHHEFQHCSVCLLLTKLSASAIMANVTQGQLSKLVGPVCEVFPSPLQRECRVLLHQQEPTFVKMMVKKLMNPRQLCSFFSFCPPDSTLRVD
ncbi:prosaposin-like [Babylonia areolata]|uniref:prosaposin-like n=1 Tax=Babylonia areolata TaxID=304850 RepID=UPI003FD62B21